NSARSIVDRLRLLSDSHRGPVSPDNGVVRVSLAAAARACAVPCSLEPWSRHATTRSSNGSATDSSPLANPSSSLSLPWPASRSQPLTPFREIDDHGSHSPLAGKDSRSLPPL